MSKATYPLKLPLSVKEAATRLAKADGVSLNQWIASAVAQKVGAMETAAEFLRRRTGDASADDFGKLLERVAAGPPQPGDELPPDRH
ncbi:pilus assembly protein HicB [Mesorhizobium sp. M0293]|uniref:pilus assembly protein HicB n=1 Tax=unclassified Mesorhizobium TaxID=325217 RepID=UPI00333BC180